MNIVLPLLAGAVINASSLNFSDVTNAIGIAISGDTVQLPSGTGIWSNDYCRIMKPLTIQGNGIGSTVIRQVGNAGNWPAIFYSRNMTTPGFVRITGMTLESTDTSSDYGLIRIGDNDGEFYRVDNVCFTNLVDRAIWAEFHGLIDNCYFHSPDASDINVQGIAVFGGGSNTWTDAHSLGTTNACVIEDCIFDFNQDQDGAMTAYDGAQYVFRHNVVSNTNIGAHGPDSGAYRSTYDYEVYNNTFSADADSGVVRHFWYRGGSGLFCSNTVSDLGAGITQTNIYLVYYRATSDNIFPLESAYRFGWVRGTNSVDGNTNEFGYPALDQFGRTGPSTYTATNSTQALRPIYSWANTFDGQGISLEIVNYTNTNGLPEVADLVVEDRDFYNDTEMPGWSPLAYPHPLRAAWPIGPDSPPARFWLGVP